MPAVAINYELLDLARQIAATFVQASSWPGWTDQQRRELEDASAAVWRGRGLLLEDHDFPGLRLRRRSAIEALVNAALIDFGPASEQPQPQPQESKMFTVKQVAAMLGLSPSAVHRRVTTRRLGRSGPARHSPQLFSAAEVQAIAKDRRQKAGAGG